MKNRQEFAEQRLLHALEVYRLEEQARPINKGWITLGCQERERLEIVR